VVHGQSSWLEVVSSDIRISGIGVSQIELVNVSNVPNRSFSHDFYICLLANEKIIYYSCSLFGL